MDTEREARRDSTSIAIIMTVFNRSDKTKRCINSIIDSKKEITLKTKIDFFITNDGSTDDTNEILEKIETSLQDISITVIKGNGTLFWNRGMYVAFEKALEKQYDYYLLVNNDVEFDKSFLSMLLTDARLACEYNSNFLLCGTCRFRDIEKRSYGGAKRLSRINPYKREVLVPNGTIQRCDIINANCVLIPYSTVKLVGNLDKRYEHALGDYDYGLRVNGAGGQCFIASGYVGACDRNSEKGTWKDPSLSILERIKKKNLPNGLPWRSEKIFLKKWFPLTWIYYLVRPYIVILITSTRFKLGLKSK